MIDLEYPFIMIHYLDVYPVVLFGYHNVAYFVAVVLFGYHNVAYFVVSKHLNKHSSTTTIPT